jgi:hypothetical protein
MFQKVTSVTLSAFKILLSFEKRFRVFSCKILTKAAISSSGVLVSSNYLAKITQKKTFALVVLTDFFLFNPPSNTWGFK